MNRQRAIITLATGSYYYYRMALALMLSCYRCAGKSYKYFIFSDVHELPGLITPDWLQVIKLPDRYYNSDVEQVTARGEGFRIKSMILSDSTIQNYDVLFLDSDCYVFKNSFENIFQLIEKNSVAIYGDFAPSGQLWGKLDFPAVALKAGYRVKNMWLNSGLIGRAADPTGARFAAIYEKLMRTYPFRPYIESIFWQAADEPYLATAFQLVMLENFPELPERIPSPSSDEYITTYAAEIDSSDKSNPIVNSAYVNGTFSPAIIHFLGGMRNSYYRGLVNNIVKFDRKGQLLRPYYRIRFEFTHLAYYLKRITNYNIKEFRDF